LKYFVGEDSIDCFQEDVHYPGRELNTGSAYTQFAESPDLCKALCQEYVQCKHWTWTRHKQCLLKDASMDEKKLLHSPPGELVTGPKFCAQCWEGCNSSDIVKKQRDEFTVVCVGDRVYFDFCAAVCQERIVTLSGISFRTQKIRIRDEQQREMSFTCEQVTQEPAQCTCRGGTEAAGADCPVSQEKCMSCRFENKLVDHRCMGCKKGDLNLHGGTKIDEMAGVKTWQACSDRCEEIYACTYWTWHKANGSKWAEICVTMTGYEYTTFDENVISGEKVCTSVDFEDCSDFHDSPSKCDARELCSYDEAHEQCVAQADTTEEPRKSEEGKRGEGNVEGDEVGVQDEEAPQHLFLRFR